MTARLSDKTLHCNTVTNKFIRHGIHCLVNVRQPALHYRTGNHKTAIYTQPSIATTIQQSTQSSMATTKQHYVHNLPWQPQNSTMYTIFHWQSPNSTMYTFFQGNHKKALCTQSSMTTTKQHYVDNLPWQPQNSTMYTIFYGNHETVLLCTQSPMATTKSTMYTIFHGNHKTALCTQSPMDGWMNQAYSRLSTTHGHITDCKL